MLFRYHFNIVISLFFLCSYTVADANCFDLEWLTNLKFYLIKSSKRSLKERLFVANVNSLEACKVLTRKFRGLAFNYSPNERFIKQNEDVKHVRDHYWQQPHLYFNCHILKCPENESFKTLINDTSFDYFSLYEKPIEVSGYVCLPEIGLFVLHTNPESFQNASLKCQHLQGNCGSLGHVASQKRTDALAQLMAKYNEEQAFQVTSRVYLVFVGLHYNSTSGHNFDFVNAKEESLKCFSYRAWQPGNPKLSSEFNNTSCVALSINRSWKTVKCERRLPYICELWTYCGDKKKSL